MPNVATVSAPEPLVHAGEAELARTRRFDRPMSLLVVVEADAEGRARPWRGRRRRSTPADRLCATVERHVRIYDAVVADPARGRVLVLAPETDAASAMRLRDRLLTVTAEVGVQRIGVATYPDDGVSLGELVHRAEERTGDHAPDLDVDREQVAR